MAVLRAEKQLNQATPENEQTALGCYGEALSRFRRLVDLSEASKLTHGILPL
jgi:hypothetical protein